MSVEANKTTAAAIVQGVATAQLDRTLFTNDAVWWMLGRGELPIDAFGEMQRKLTQQLLAGDGNMVVHGIIAEGDRVAVEAEVSVPLRNGGTYHTDYHFLFRFRDGKVCQVKEYYDTAAAQQAFQGKVPRPDLGEK